MSFHGVLNVSLSFYFKVLFKIPFFEQNRELGSNELITRQRALMSLCDVMHNPENISEGLRVGRYLYRLFKIQVARYIHVTLDTESGIAIGVSFSRFLLFPGFK